MIEEIKNQFYPDWVSPPGETLQDVLEERGMSQAELAERTGRPHKTMNEIIKGKSGITPETALQLEHVLGISAEFWNNREAQYRQFLAQKEEAERLAQEIEWVKKFPIREMMNRKWIKQVAPHSIAAVIEVLNFFGVASPEQWEVGWTKHRLSFRRSQKFETKTESTAVWIRRGEIEAEQIQCADYDGKEFEKALIEIRTLTKETDPSVFVPKLQEICAATGVAVLFVPPLKGAPVCGVARWINPKKALMQLSLRYKTDDQIWFAFFHEAAHVLLHSKKEIFIDLGNGDADSKAHEDEADLFASECLIPQDKLDIWLSKSSVFSKARAVEFSKHLGISPGILVGRLQFLKKIPFTHLNELKTRYKWSDDGGS